MAAPLSQLSRAAQALYGKLFPGQAGLAVFNFIRDVIIDSLSFKTKVEQIVDEKISKVNQATDIEPDELPDAIIDQIDEAAEAAVEEKTAELQEQIAALQAQIAKLGEVSGVVFDPSRPEAEQESGKTTEPARQVTRSRKKTVKTTEEPVTAAKGKTGSRRKTTASSGPVGSAEKNLSALADLVNQS